MKKVLIGITLNIPFVLIPGCNDISGIHLQKPSQNTFSKCHRYETIHKKCENTFTHRFSV